MFKCVSIALGAAALMVGTAASAAVTVTAPTNLTDPNPQTPSSIATADGTTTIEFGLNATGNSFSSAFTFENDVAGLYNFFIGTSTDGLLFTDVTITGGGTTTTFAPPSATVIQAFGLNLLANTPYTVNINGTSTASAGAFSGNVTIHEVPAVPEAATWAMMLLGFGGMGLAMRSRRSLALAQIA